MIKVLEHGSIKITCPYCKAKLQYEKDDVKKEQKSADFMFNEENSEIKYIICPDCENKIIIGPTKR